MEKPKIGIGFLVRALIVAVLLLMITSSASAVVGSHSDAADIPSVDAETISAELEEDEAQVALDNGPDGKLSFDTELVHLRTRTSKSYQQEDGNIGVKIGQTSMHYQGVFGDWEDIDTTILEADVGAYTYGCPTNGLKTFFDWDSAKSRVKGPGHEPIVWTPGDMVYTENGKAVSYSPRASVGAVTDDVITFRDTYKGTHEVYSVKNDALKHEYILDAAPEFLSEDGEYLEYTGTLDLGENQVVVIDQQVGATDTWTTSPIIIAQYGEEGAYEIPTPVAFEQGFTGEIEVLEHKITFNGLDYTYSVRVNVDWLLDGERSYPVVIDPTYMYIYTYQYVSSPLDYPTGYTYYNTAYGKVSPTTTASYIYTGRSGTTYYRAWAKWNIATIPATAEVTYWRVSMRCRYASWLSTFTSTYKRIYTYDIVNNPTSAAASTLYADSYGGTYMGYSYNYAHTGTTTYYNTYYYGSTTAYNAVETARDTRTWWAQGFRMLYDTSYAYYQYYYGWYTGSTTYEPYIYCAYAPNVYTSVVTGGTVFPTTGTPATTFQYRVNYQDSDNEYPTQRYVFHNYLGTASYYGYFMSYTGTPSAGLSCYYNRAGSTYTIGTYPFKFYFRFYDGFRYYYRSKSGTTTGAVATTQYFDGPIIKQPPFLSGGKFNPLSGLKTDTFYINVTVTDVDADPVTKSNVVIDGTPYAMTYVSGAIKTGALYSYSTTGAALGGGVHQTYFDFATSDGTTRLPTSGTYPRPTVFNNTLPILVGGKVSPAYGATTTMFTYEVTYMDANSNPPAAGYPKVIIDNVSTFSMTYVSGNWFSGALFRFTTSTLGIGTHSYRFNATDGMDWAIQGAALNSGPTVNSQTAPTLTPWKPLGVSTPVDPKSGSTYENYTFTATYKDLNNDPPAYVYLYIDTNPTPYTMAKMPAEDGIYYNDENYTVKVPGSVLGVGTHEFYFETSDGLAPTLVYNPAGPPIYGTGGRHTFTIYDHTIGPNGTIGSTLNLTDESINPVVGPAAGTFTYKVTYESGSKPMRYGTNLEENPKVVIDGILEYELIPSNPADIIFHDGKEYYITISGNTIRNTGVANHYFYFTGSNGNLMNKTDINYGPNFSPILYNGGVTPDEGKESDSYTFEVWYQDPEGLAPALSELYIDAMPPVTMTLASEPTYTSGALYRYTLADASGLVDPVRIHTYYFKFEDQIPSPSIPSNGTASLPASGRYQFTVVQAELPDLKVGNSDIDVINKGGTVRQFKANVHNIGLGDVPASKNVQVELYWKDPDGAGPSLLVTRSVSGNSFTSGKSVAVDFGNVDLAALPFPTTGVGQYDIYVTIEHGAPNSISELIPKVNNKAFINVRLGADLAITAGDIQPSSVMSDEDMLYVTVTIRNVGPDVASFSGADIVDLKVTINPGGWTKTIPDLWMYDRNNLVSGKLTNLNPGSAVTIRVPVGDVSTLFGTTKSLSISVEINTDGSSPNEIVPYSSTSPTNNIAESSIAVAQKHHVSPSFAPPVAALGVSLTLLAMIPVVKHFRRKRKDNKETD